MSPLISQVLGRTRQYSLTLARQTQHRCASRLSIPIQSALPPPFPVRETCPAATCACRATPAGLEIEREQSLNGSMAAYAEQVLISTGRTDWTSRVEADPSPDMSLVRSLKGLLGRGGKYADPYHNVLLTTSSFASESSPDASSQSPDTHSSIYLLPSFTYIPSIAHTAESVESLVQAFILPRHLHPAHNAAPSETLAPLQRRPELQKLFPQAQPVTSVLVLICGHGQRDSRCGILGPILQAEFEESLARQTNIKVLSSQSAIASQSAIEAEQTASNSPSNHDLTARVAQISHIGGHKFAGNIIIYIPPTATLQSPNATQNEKENWETPDSKPSSPSPLKHRPHPLAGTGIWYGRVGPEHVQGIIESTILQGEVIQEFFRGGIDSTGKILRL